jgi:uncharacterized membrane protein
MKAHDKTAAFVSRITAWVGSVQSLAIHTCIFILIFILGAAGFASWEFLLLVLTTVVSLEAIYLAIFIQYTVNRQAESLKEVEEDIDEIQEDVEELSEDMDEIQEDIEEISEDIDEIQEDVEEMTEEEKVELERKSKQKVTLEQLTSDVRRVLTDLEELKKGK